MSEPPRIPITLTRDSVCAGDDGDAPHEKLVTAVPTDDPGELARALAAGYLASVAGVGHTWTCVLNGIDVAEITHSGFRSLVASISFAETNRVHFVYHSATY